MGGKAYVLHNFLLLTATDIIPRSAIHDILKVSKAPPESLIKIVNDMLCQEIKHLDVIGYNILLLHTLQQGVDNRDCQLFRELSA